jgi:hypothetical protein
MHQVHVCEVRSQNKYNWEIHENCWPRPRRGVDQIHQNCDPQATQM